MRILSTSDRIGECDRGKVPADDSHMKWVKANIMYFRCVPAANSLSLGKTLCTSLPVSFAIIVCGSAKVAAFKHNRHHLLWKSQSSAQNLDALERGIGSGGDSAAKITHHLSKEAKNWWNTANVLTNENSPFPYAKWRRLDQPKSVTCVGGRGYKLDGTAETLWKYAISIDIIIRIIPSVHIFLLCREIGATFQRKHGRNRVPIYLTASNWL